MNMNIGFRVKLNDYIDDRTKLQCFLNLYFSKFNIMEVKVNDYLTKNRNLEYFLSEIADKSVSFHLSKNFINKVEKSDEIILSYINNMDSFLITHVPEIIDENNFDISIEKIANNTLLFENPKDFINGNYIEYLIYFYNKLLSYNKCNICLDLGHLYFNELMYNNYNNIDVLLNNISKDRVLEYHLHDYNLVKDHLPIGMGLLQFNQLDVCVHDEKRIILETDVSKCDLSDGVEQVKRILTRR